MGCFDSVMVTCIRCTTVNELQSKAGACSLSTYDLDDAPPEILLDIADKKFSCENCLLEQEIKVKVITFANVRRAKKETDE